MNIAATAYIILMMHFYCLLNIDLHVVPEINDLVYCIIVICIVYCILYIYELTDLFGWSVQVDAIIIMVINPHIL